MYHKKVAPYSVLSLFSGIAGLCCLGIAAAKLSHVFQTTQFVENNDYCQRILAKHFPAIPIHPDIRTFNPTAGQFDVVCGGFPCQPFSQAGQRKGKQDERYLWDEVMRIICTVKPRWFLGENVPGLLSIDSGRVFGGILRDLAQCGYDAEWSLVSAAEVGAVHKRERVFIIAYPSHPKSPGWRTPWSAGTQTGTNIASISSGENAISHTNSNGCTSASSSDKRRQAVILGSSESPHANLTGLETRFSQSGQCSSVGELERQVGSDDWAKKTQPRVCRGDARISYGLDRALMTHADLPKWLPKATDTDNIPYRKERLQALGNSVVPQQGAIAWKKLYGSTLEV